MKPDFRRDRKGRGAQSQVFARVPACRGPVAAPPRTVFAAIAHRRRRPIELADDVANRLANAHRAGGKYADSDGGDSLCPPDTEP